MARPRGYAPWSPRPETEALVETVAAILTEYRDHLPLTIRQIFYRLVGAYGYAKTEQAYARLCEHLVRARRAELIPFAAIRDDGARASGPAGGYADPSGFWEAELEAAKAYESNRMDGQPVRMELWCEAAGMLPQMAAIARPYHVRCYSTGGFSSVTVTYEIAQRAERLGRGRPTVFLHVGDYDPSGESIFESMVEDAAAFAGEAGAEIIGKRVVLTPEQIAEHALETAPPKPSDSRSRNWEGETCQAEALPPDILAEYVRAAIEEELDLDRRESVLEREEEEREQLIDQVQEILDSQ